ncbi:MAG: hypothetical protein M3Y59_10910 [Myxococcota bacterium]|nr:hypothetical protein [Myxococcota bacterium]
MVHAERLTEVPRSLRRWFVVHFLADVVVAVPLFISPQLLLLLGWEHVDPISTRLVCAALFGIGIESWLGRNGPIESFRAMLNLKVLWSGTAVFGLLLSMIQGGPPFGWAVFGIFAAFNGLWVYYRLRLGR